MSLPRQVEKVLRTLVELPDDNYGPADWASLDAARDAARGEIERLDRRVAAKAAVDAQRAERGVLNVTKRPTRKPDPPELVRNRALAYERAMGVCEAGSPWCEGRPTQVHHIARRRGAGAHALTNLLAVCGMGNTSGCHGWIHQHPDEAKAKDWLRSPDALPAVVNTKGDRSWAASTS